MRKSWILISIWILGTGFAMAMAGFAVRLAGAGVTDGALPALESSEITAELEADESDPATTGTTPVAIGDAGFAFPATGSAPTTTAAPGPGSGQGVSGGAGSASAPTAAAPPVTVDDRGGSGGSGGSGSAGAPAPAPAPAPTTTAPPSSSHTIAAIGGSVTVRCVGSTVSILAASPSGGFSVDVRDPGPDEIEVRFESKDRTSTVKATCLAGVAQPRVQESGKD